jgi:hypothetical protein
MSRAAPDRSSLITCAALAWARAGRIARATSLMMAAKTMKESVISAAVMRNMASLPETVISGRVQRRSAGEDERSEAVGRV